MLEASRQLSEIISTLPSRSRLLFARYFITLRYSMKDPIPLLPIAKCLLQRAAISNQLLSTLTEPLFTSALARARFLDDHLTRTGLPVGRLHGLPISVKDTFDVVGIDSTVGISTFAFRPASQNAAVVDLLLAMGAVIHCKTNVPQSMLALDSVNNIFGRTLNPLNREKWTAGGSSGGEAALVAMKGCVMGVGTDVGGSVRIPAFVNGVVGLKPGKGRISAKGLSTGQLDAYGKVGMEAVVGPIARSLDDIDLFMEVAERGKVWERDPEVLHQEGWWTCLGDDMRIGEKLQCGKLRVGVLWDDGNVLPHPPVRNMLWSLTRKLQARGIEVMAIDPHASGFSKCQGLTNKFFSVEGGAHLHSLIESTSEPLIPWLAPRLKRRQPATVDRLRSLHAQKLELETQMLKIWKDIDLLLCPVAPHPVPPPDRWNAIGYTSAFVLLDYPAGVVQVGTVDIEDLKSELEGDVKGEWDRINRGLWHEQVREGYLGSPLAVQVVAPKGRERRCWEGMRAMEEIVKGVEKKTGKGPKL